MSGPQKPAPGLAERMRALAGDAADTDEGGESFTALAAAVGRVEHRLADLQGETRRLGEAFEALRAALPGQLEDALEPVAEALTFVLPPPPGGSAEPAGEAGSVVESRLAELEDALAGVAERLEAFARDGAATTISRLDALAAAVAQLGAAGGAAGGAAPVTAADLDNLRAELAGAVRELSEQLGRDVRARLGRPDAPPPAGAGQIGP